jgi:Asp/Glu/hydantoin racemase
MGLLFCIHTTSFLVAEIQETISEILAGHEVGHITDDGLLTELRRAGGLTSNVARKICGYALNAADAGADAIMICCSTASKAAVHVQPFVSVPIFSVDEPMAEEAVRTGTAIGVLATLPTTIKPTCDLLRRKAAAVGRQIAPHPTLCDKAFDALRHGDRAQHDALLLEEVRRSAATNDVVLLAQVSMARLLPRVGADVRVPVLASLRSGLQRGRKLLERARENKGSRASADRGQGGL